MTAGAHTQSNGQVYYRAGQTLTVNTIHTDAGLPGGTVILEGRNLRSNATAPGSIRAGQLDARCPTVTAIASTTWSIPPTARRG